ncbi:alpha-2-macroglobulin family protein [Euzebya rosea]|uniref:alpha-2-macroglobulin family protein n=1 Tax=Euzebya rosea TaxID=2052804 RepID=UPI000D3E64D1|nr:alpha-2-macroglobulin family protein [Euzebya rosea]
MPTTTTRLRGLWPLFLSVFIALAVVATMCTVSGDDEDDVNDATAEDGTPAATDEDGQPLRVRLRQGQSVAQADDPVEVATGTPLEADRVDAIIDRLEPFGEEEGDRQAFNRPAETLPPPVAGQTVPTTFPPAGGDDAAAPDVPAGPLEVVRVQPEGEVDIAPSLSITFNQPMVPLATLEQLDAADVPVTVTPELDGRWRWIGTRTLRFEHTPGTIDRLPMATAFTVTVPAGTTSETGGTLAQDVTFDFATPAPTVEAFAPQGNSLVLQPTFVAVFDQVVDPAAVLDHLTLDADGTRPVRQATPEEIDADDTVRPIVDRALDGRWVAFRPVEPLPADTPLTVTFGEGMPSAEGPRTTAAEQRYSGRTFPPLRIVRTECGYGQGCRPGQPLLVEFSNPLDTAAFEPATVTVEPELRGATIGVQGNVIVVQGATEADTTYRVTVPASLRDDRGQVLGAEETREFDVGDPMPFLRRFDSDMVTVDPLAEQPSVSLVSAGHEDLRVVALDVEPDDWSRYIALDRWSDELTPPDFPVLFDRTVETGASDGTTVETIVDLSEAFPDGAGQALLYVEPNRTFPRDSEEYWNNLQMLVWVQATTVGIDAFADGEQLVVWTTDLRDGSPIAGAEVAHDGGTATTDADGLATFRLDSSGDPTITATVGDQTAVLGSGWRERWQAQPRNDVSRWYVFDDRGLYRPGETVRLKGWIRQLRLSGNADLVLPGDGASVDYQVFDGQYTEIGSGQVDLNALGAFDLAIELPAGANLGYGTIAFQLSGVPGLQDTFFEHPLRIEEFRRPEFEVATRAESPAPHVVTSPITVAAEATYFAGGGLPNAPVTWTVSHRDGTYEPPGWEGFSFGIFVPWWFVGGGSFGGRGFEAEFGAFEQDICCFPGGEETVERFEGVTDASGAHFLEIELEGDAPDQPTLVSANAAVEDVNRQAFASTTDLLVHAGQRYLGLRSDRAFVRQGDPIRMDAVLTDIDGTAIVGEPLVLTAERLVEEYVDGVLTETAVDPRTCELTSAAEPQRCEFATEVGGRYRISGTVTDADGGTNRTEYEMWVSGAEAVPTRRIEQEQLTLIPARQDYVVGDTAEILVPAPFGPATGLVTVTHNGIASTRVVGVTDGSAVVEIPLADDMVPGITVQVDLVGAAPRLLDDGSPAPDLPARPAYATGSVRIDVPPTSRTLTVDAVPRDTAIVPGGSTAVDVTVTDAAGTPVEGADLAVVVVDEAVLSLIGYDLADPVATFHGDLYTWLDSEYLRRTILLSRADTPVPAGTDGDREESVAEGAEDEALFEVTEDAAADTDGTAGGATAAAAPLAATPEGEQGGGAPIEVRSDFDALAVFAPSVTTDAAGRATVDVDLPDNLTRYRILAVAASGNDRFGKGESTLTARLPLQVRPSAPRFANFGDAFQLPVVLQNQTDTDLTADVVLETANLAVEGPDETRTGTTVTVPANNRVEVRFPVTAADAGTARFRATAVSSSGDGESADSATVSLPVHTPTTSESFATYGVVDEGAVAQPLLTPDGVVPQFGGLEVTTSSTALQALTDAVLYLSDYPYTSSDAFASRILASAALRDVLEAFEAEQLPPAAEIEQTVAADIAGLVGLQNDDGGWPVWQRNRPTEPYHTIQAAHALIAARDAGYDVPSGTLDRALERLRSIEAVIDPEWSETTRQTIRAYAVHVRDLAGDRDPGRAAEVYRALEGATGDDDTLPLDAIAWLWPVVDDADIRAAIERTFANQVTETPSAATFVTGYGEDAYLVLGSDRRTDGIVLDAYLDQQPDSDLVPKIVNGLIANQKQGRWDNVQENAFVLLALKRYFDTFEATTPDFVARVWLGDLYAAEHPYQGRSTDSMLTVVPTAELLSREDPTIVLSKDGEGRLYYRLGLRTAPDDLRLEPRDEGFVVERAYEAVGDPGDVVLGDDGTWRIRAGAEVRVRLTMVADSRRVNMALVDPLPAGLEIVNPALAASPALPPEPEEPSDFPSPGEICCDLFDSIGWFPTWFDHQNLRDDRAEAFSGYLPAGTYTYDYIARATTPGTFVVPPTKAEEIYTPEVFGRSATDTVVVEG